MSTEQDPGFLDQFAGTEPSTVVITMVAIPLAMIIGSLLMGIAIKLSASLLKLGKIEFGQATIAALVGCVVQFSFGFSIGASYSLLNPQTAEFSREYGYRPFQIEPLVIVILTAMILLLTALIYNHILRVDNGASRLLYRDSLVLTAVSQAMLTALLWVVYMYIALVGSMTATPV